MVANNSKVKISMWQILLLLLSVFFITEMVAGKKVRSEIKKNNVSAKAEVCFYSQPRRLSYLPVGMASYAAGAAS